MASQLLFAETARKFTRDRKIMTKQSVDEDATHPDDIMTEEELKAVDTPSLGISVRSDTADVKSIEVGGSYS